MKMVKSLLLGSAAGLLTIAGAQAADFPVKAKPVEYVKVCTLYGAGYYYIPGSDTCIKIGFYFRYQWGWDEAGGRMYITGANAAYTRTDTPDLEHRIRALFSFDVRTQTEYGTLRFYMNGGFQQTIPTTSDEAFDWYRGFVQFAGFTVGRSTSFYDFLSLAAYSNTNNVVSPDMGATGQQVFAYTQQFGNGWSASLSLEDGGAAAAGNAGTNSRSRSKLTADLGGPGSINAVFAVPAATAVYDNGAYTVPDIVANVRVDQAWGSAQVSGALHLNKGGYYTGSAGAGAPCSVANSNTNLCGHPDDEWGAAIAAGVQLNLPTGQGDLVAAMVTYGKGASGYVTRVGSGFRIWGHGDTNAGNAPGSIGFGLATDSMFAAPGTIAGYDGSLQLTEQWGVSGVVQHVWSPQWRSMLYAGYSEINHNATETALICSTVTAAGTTPRGFTGITLAGGAAQCTPDFSWYQVGVQTQWNPHPSIAIRLDLGLVHLNTAFAGGGATTAASGARPAQAVVIEDQDVFYVQGRWEYTLNF